MRRIAARASSDFFGREVELAKLDAAAAQGARNVNRLIAVTGPAGSGRRELLRQVALRCWSSETPALPLCLHAEELGGGGTGWPHALAELVRIALLRWAEQSKRTF